MAKGPRRILRRIRSSRAGMPRVAVAADGGPFPLAAGYAYRWMADGNLYAVPPAADPVPAITPEAADAEVRPEGA